MGAPSPLAESPPAASRASDIAAQVRAQLKGDYPADVLAWVDGLTWTGPAQVPVSQVDRSRGTADWSAAAGDTAKLALFKHKIAGGFRKPVVLVRTPGSAKLLAVDGHTRTLACLALGQPVTAWVGTAKTAHGPWEALHSRQFSNDSTALNLASAPGLTSRSGMISLDLPDGTIKPVPGGLDDHHVTVVYLGPDLDDGAFDQACARVKDAAAQADGPLTGTVSGVSSFKPSPGSDGKVPAFAPVAIPGAQALRSKLQDLSASEHKDWVPHVTLAYISKGDPLPDPVPPTPVRFTHLSVHRGDEVRRFPLGSGSEHAGDGGSRVIEPVELSAQTAVLEVTPNPWGSPSGPGLWKHKGLRLPAYVEQVSKGIMKSGRAASESEAIQMAIGVLKRWAAGGGKVTPEVRAAAVKAIAEWEALKAGAHAHANAGQRVIDLVGPKGFIHGWIFVGVPGVGAQVYHPAYGHGVITGHGGGRVSAKFAKTGRTASFPHVPGDAGQPGALKPQLPDAAGPVSPPGRHVDQALRVNETEAHESAVRIVDGIKAGTGDAAARRSARAQAADGDYKAAAATLRAEAATLSALGGPYAKDAARLTAAAGRLDKAKPKTNLLPPLVKTGSSGLREVTAVDHKGRQYVIRLADDGKTVTVTGPGGTRTEPVTALVGSQITSYDATQAARKAAGHVTGHDGPGPGAHASPQADAPESPFTIIRKQSGKGWAVREEGQPGWVHSSPTRQGAQDYADRVVKQRAALAASEAEGNARTAALLKSRGIGPVDYRNLQPGDQFTWDPEIPPKTVLRVQHLASGASLITWEKDAHTPKGENQTLMAPGHKAYGRLSGHSHAGDAPAVDLAGVFTEALHPRVGGRFASKGGGKVTAARQRHGANTPAVQRPAAAGPGQTRAQQLRYQAAQDRHIAGQIMVKVAGLVRARDAAIAGLPAPAGKTASATSAAAKATAAASSRTRAKSAAAKAAAKFAAGKTPVSRVAKLDGQIRLLRRDARLLIQAADHLDQQASGL